MVIVLSLAMDASAPSMARQAVRSALAERSQLLIDVAVLLANEIVTNSVVHATGDIELRLEDSHDSVRVEVSDGSSAPPRLGTPILGQERGRGMLIVDALASSWGVRETENGKTVWFELDSPDGAA